VSETYDVAVVGAGNAGLCAALSAADRGARVVVLERAPEHLRGGNSAFTAGAMRVAYRGVDDLRRLMPQLTDDEMAVSDFGTYTESDFFSDLAKVTEYRSDPDMADLLVTRSFDTLMWMASKGVRFMPIYGRQAFRIGGRFRFWGGLTIETNGGGPGLVAALFDAAESAGVDVWYDSRATSLIMDDSGVRGVELRRNGSTSRLIANSVVLASGGFEANAEWRARYLGKGWDIAKVRGSRFNTGDGIRMALEAGAMPHGNWSGCHAVGWDRNAPDFGDLEVGDGFQKHSYPFGIMLNAEGRRFVDEGADFRNYTYAKYGQVILEQPGQFAWQIFDRGVAGLLRDEYRIRQVTKVTADSLEDLVSRLDGVDPEVALSTITEFNDSVRIDVPFDPNVLDGRRADLAIPKSNWANPLLEPPFEAYQVTCGITFTFGGLKISTDGEVVDTDGQVIPRLFACGELVGGIFYFNYPGGSGLTSGSVFGRIAGDTAGKLALASRD